jgi:ATP-dependent exoDNAse (exonuclease V) alpha subunit
MKYMEYHKTTDAMFLDHTKKDEDDRASSIYIYQGLPVMATVNRLKPSKKDNNQTLFCNSDALTVLEFNKDIIKMKLEIPDENGNDIVEIKTSEFHKSFVCNYCSTTHKQQGATLTKNIQLWDWYKMTEDRRIAYTAVSRAKTISQVKIISSITKY